MQLVFPRTNQAITYTLEYYRIGRIKDYMFHFAGTERFKVTPDPLASWDEFILELHDGMEQEINQVILTTNSNTQVIFFEFLKEWLSDYRISSVDDIQMHYEILQYNNSTYTEFVDRVEKKVNEFRSTENFKTKKHNEKYEYEVKGWANLIGYTETRINYGYYCIEEKPELIDIAYFSQYVLFVSGFIANFKRILNKYVSLYDSGKINPSVQPMDKLLSFNSSEQPSLPEIKKIPKLRVNITVEQLAYLFKMLKGVSVVDNKVDADIVRFISDNFETQKTKGAISTNKLSTLYSRPKKETATYWIAILRKMITEANNL
jgi:hypothetical protein